MDIAKLLKENLMINENGEKAIIKIEGKENINSVRCWLDTMEFGLRVEDLDFSTRIYNCIYRYFDREYSVEDLVSLVENGKLDEVKYLGKKGKAEVIRILTREGLIRRGVAVQ